MKNLEKVVKATVNGEAQEHTLTVEIPEDHPEAVEVYGEEEVYKGFVRMLVTDKTNAERVAMKGGEAKLKRKKVKDLIAKLMDDPDLLDKVQKKTGIEL